MFYHIFFQLHCLAGKICLEILEMDGKAKICDKYTRCCRLSKPIIESLDISTFSIYT